jgi:hypothetical protein
VGYSKTNRHWIAIGGRACWLSVILLVTPPCKVVAQDKPLRDTVQEVQDTVQDWGLLGTWSYDCSVEIGGGLTHRKMVPNARNVLVKWVSNSTTAGAVLRIVEQTKGAEESVVNRAQLLPNGMLEIELLNRATKVTYRQILEKTPAGRNYRQYESTIILPELKPSIKAGKRIGRNTNIAWLNRCPEVS